MKAPFVCNGCKSKSSDSCHYQRRIYLAKTAQQQYEKTLVSSREGIALNKIGFYVDDGWSGLYFDRPVLLLKTPKTKTSVRKVYIPKTVAEMLVKRKEQIEEMKAL